MPGDSSIITGMSGAGRSTAAKALEDLDWFVVDNLPPGLLADHGRPGRAGPGRRRQGGRRRRRAQPGLHHRPQRRHRGAGGARRRVRGWCSSRPATRSWSAGSRTYAGRTRSRATAGWSTASPASAACCARSGPRPTWSSTPPRSTSTSCAPRSSASSAARTEPGLRATCVSFGYKYGLPVDADLVVDCRFLPNPHWMPELRPQNGRDAAVRDYVLASRGPRSSSTPTTRCCGCSPPDTSARARLRHARGRLHGRQAPQRGHGRAARRPAARRGHGRPGRPPGCRARE